MQKQEETLSQLDLRLGMVGGRGWWSLHKEVCWTKGMHYRHTNMRSLSPTIRSVIIIVIPVGEEPWF
jgi:hypothetical protein